MKVGKFIRFMVSKNRIEPNSEKLKALINMSSPRTLKEVLILTGQNTMLNRFISKMANRCLLFFKSLYNITNFVWIEKFHVYFEDLKKYLGSPLTPDQSQCQRYHVLVFGYIAVGGHCGSAKRKE